MACFYFNFFITKIIPSLLFTTESSCNSLTAGVPALPRSPWLQQIHADGSGQAACSFLLHQPGWWSAQRSGNLGKEEQAKASPRRSTLSQHAPRVSTKQHCNLGMRLGNSSCFWLLAVRSSSENDTFSPFRFFFTIFILLAPYYVAGSIKLTQFLSLSPPPPPLTVRDDWRMPPIWNHSPGHFSFIILFTLSSWNSWKSSFLSSKPWHLKRSGLVNGKS